MSGIQQPSRTAVFWFTGLPASGKTTLARALFAHLGERFAAGTCCILDADIERTHSDGVLYGLGWSQTDRRATVAALAHAATLVPVALVTLVTSTRWERDEAARHLGERLHLIHIDAPIILCRQRDALRENHAYRPSPPPDAPELSWAPPTSPALRLDTNRPLQQSAVELIDYAESVLTEPERISLPESAPGV
jgi:bifunctional enzyme CysN/CysC